MKSFVCGKSSMESEKLLTASILSKSSLALPFRTHSWHSLPDTELLFIAISTPLLFVRLYKDIRWSTTCNFRQWEQFESHVVKHCYPSRNINVQVWSTIEQSVWFSEKCYWTFYETLSLSFRMGILYNFQTLRFSALKSNLARKVDLICLPFTTMAPEMTLRISIHVYSRRSTKVTLYAIVLHVDRLLLKLARMRGHTILNTFHWLVYPRAEHFLKSRGRTETVHYVRQFFSIKNVHKNSWQRLLLKVLGF